MNWDRVTEALEHAAVDYEKELEKTRASGVKRGGIADAVFPGAVLLVGRGGEVLYSKAVGARSLIPELTPMSEDVVFDVASLTKVIVTTALAMQLFDSGQLALDRRLSRIFQSFSSHGKESMTIGHLLTHTSGYPATIPFFRTIARANEAERTGMMASRGAVDFVINESFRWKLENVPGKVAKYSDIGFILLAHAVEVMAGGQYLEKLAVKKIFAPLKLHSTGFVELSKIKRRGLEAITSMIAPTIECSWRGHLLCGEVHDDNAWAMGGVAGHAGVFSTAADVHRFATEMIDCYHGRGSLVSQQTVRKFWTRDGTVSGSTWAYGWDTPSAQGSSSGHHFGEGSVGHLGFTGCSLWIDPERELDVVLLSNRIHPSIENQRIKDFRPKIHDLVMETLGYAK